MTDKPSTVQKDLQNIGNSLRVAVHAAIAEMLARPEAFTPAVLDSVVNTAQLVLMYEQDAATFDKKVDDALNRLYFETEHD